jgi:hypothetical protein
MFEQVAASIETQSPRVKIRHPKRPVVVPPVYWALVGALEERRLQIGISMERVAELAGTADRSFAKALSPESVSGRQVRFETLELYFGALFPEGYQLRVIPTKSGAPTRDGTRRMIESAARHYDQRCRYAHLREIGRKGQATLVAKYLREERSAFARKAAKTRIEKWRREKAA